MSKGGLTRHTRSKHLTGESDEQAETTTQHVAINADTVGRILKETVEKLREENIYSNTLIDTIFSLKPSDSFVEFICKVFSLFCRKRNQDAMLAMFYGDILKDWKDYFPPCSDQMAINVLLIHLPQKLVAYHKSATSTQGQEHEQVCVNCKH